MSGYERALADAGVTLEDLGFHHAMEQRAGAGTREWRNFADMALLALPALLAGCRETDDQRARADKAVAEAEALCVERDEADAEIKCLDEQCIAWVRAYNDAFTRAAAAAEATLTETQRQAAEAERAGMERAAKLMDSRMERCQRAAAAEYDAQLYDKGLESEQGARNYRALAQAIRALAPPSAPGSAETEGDKP